MTAFTDAQRLSLTDILAEIEAEEVTDGDCPFREQCEERRRQLSTYRQYVPCHWITWWHVAGCSIYQSYQEVEK